MPADPTASPAAQSAPLPEALGFEALRERALVTLQRLAGSTWTDHNTHDPGITLLESLCYAITDLAYRTSHPVADLLAGLPGGGTGLYTPDQVLPCGPVTTDDLRRLVIDLPGVKNAWVDTVDEPLALHDAAQGLLGAVSDAAGLASQSPNVSALRPRGLVRLRIEKSGLGEDIDGGALVRLAAQRVQQWRGLGEDIADIDVLDRQHVALDGAIEIAPGADAAETLAAVYQAVAQYMSPDLPRHSLREMLQRGWPVDQIFEGPLLQRGFLDPAEWAALKRRSTLRVSDLIQVLMAVPGVQAVRRLGFLRDGLPSTDWLLPIPPDRSASFDMPGSRLQLQRAGLRVDHESLRAQAQRLVMARLRLAAVVPAAAGPDDALAPPAGRQRDLARYLSVQHHLPQVYGVGPVGLSANEPPERHAQAHQLKAYLTLFDQLLANQFAQLAHAGRLLAFDDTGSDTLFAQAVPDDDGALQLDTVRRQPAAAQAEWLTRITRNPWGEATAADQHLAHRHRLADHLLARLGERWGEYRPLPDADGDQAPVADGDHPAQADDGHPAATDDAVSPRQRMLRDKQAFLRDYPRLSLRRGVGMDAMAGAVDAQPAGLAQRLARVLGVADAALPLHLVEHILLRPLPDDARQQGPLMRAALSPDPFSLQLSLVLPAQDARWADADLRQRLAQAVAAETPAHLAVRLLWLDDAALARFTTAWQAWRALWAAELQRRHGGGPAAPLNTSSAASAAEAPATDVSAVDIHPWALRSARNRVIDALALGDTFALTDLPVAGGAQAGPIKVAHGQSARITIDASEDGVAYALRGPGGAALVAADGTPLPAIQAPGNGGRLVLESPPVTDNIAFRIAATKLPALPAEPDGPAPHAALLLAQEAPVEVGIDLGLALALPDLPLLDAGLATPQPGDVRLARHGDRVRVQVLLSQEGVAYALVVGDQVQPEVVVGDMATIVLTSPPLTEDCSLGVQATRRFAAAGSAPSAPQALQARLAVAVRADPTRALQLQPGPVLDAHQPGASLQVQASQASARYQLWVQRVRHAHWMPAPDDSADTTGGPWLQPEGLALPMRLPAPAWPEHASVPSGFVPVGEARPGHGGALDLPLPVATDDLVCLVQAVKTHASAAEATVDSHTTLIQPVLVLVRPEARPALQLGQLLGPSGGPQLRLQGGQPGVAYQVSGPGADAPAWPQRAYVHQRDDSDAATDQGVSQLRLGVDLAVAADADAGLPQDLPRSDRAALTVAAPLIDMPALAADTVLVLRAEKVHTGLGADLAARARLLPWPRAELDPRWVAPGARATLALADTRDGLHYQLWRDGRPLADAVPGNGGSLALDTGEVPDDSRLLLRSGPGSQALADLAAQGELAVGTDQWILLRVLPRADITWAAQRNEVQPGQGTQVLLDSSQPGVSYQLLQVVDGQPQALGEAQPGQGGALALPTGVLVADTRFQVLAQRTDLPEGRTLLAGEVVVAVQAPVPDARPAPATPASADASAETPADPPADPPADSTG